MTKKLLTMTIGLMLAAGVSAQYGNYPYPASNIQFWTGSGSNSAVVVISWDDEDASYSPQGFAWGVQFNGTISAHNLLDTIAAYDSRFTFSFSNTLLSTIAYHDATNNVHLTPSIQYNCFYVNGSFAPDVYDNITITNGDMMEISESCYFDCTNITPATDPNGGSTPSTPDTVDASLPFSDILYWVGSGSDSAEFIVSFGQPDTAFAWGFLYNPGTTIQQMIDAIDAADPRFWVDGNPSMSGDLHFITNGGDTLGLSPVDPTVGYNFWWTNLNGMSVASLSTALTNGDVFKYGDFNSATGWDYQYGYYMQEAWNTVPTPVPAPADPAPVEATIAASDILYWVGTGSNQAILAVNWADTALAWGFRWNGTATVSDMMDAIATADPRVSYSGTGLLNDILFNDGTVSLAGTPGNYWGSTNNGVMDMGMGQTLANGDFEKWADPAAGFIIDSTYDSAYSYWWYTYAYPMTIHPVSVPGDPAPAEATIAASDILYWVGTGSNQAILAVNWADTALAWGFRWNGTATVSDMMDAIATADPRLTVDGTGFVNDILYIDTASGMTDTLHITLGNYWGSTNNGFSDAGMGQTLADGDLEKWADPAAGVMVDSASYEYEGVTYWYYIYAYPMTIHPVSIPDTTGQGPVDPQHGPFCGAVGTEGCDAIIYNSNDIVAWATGCTVDRGPVDITDPTGPRVHYGTDQMGIGPATTSTTNAVSLGDGGTATLTFALPIANGEGPDFAVFENSFNDYFLELAFVEVSSDGVRFVRFPATSLTPTDVQVGSNGSVDPTNINNLAGKYRVGYGTPFDLEELADSTGLDINSITHVRLVDVVGSIDPQYGTFDAFGHIVNDPWPTNDTVYGSGGFDLTGLAVLHQSTNGIDAADSPMVGIYPNPAANVLNISSTHDGEARLMDINGRTVATVQLRAGTTTLNIATFPAGIYMLQCGSSVSKVVKF